MLKSKLTLITGAGSGIGKATCIAFAKEKAKVIAVDQNKEHLGKIKEILNGMDMCHSGFQMDVSRSDDIKSVINEIFSNYKEPPSVIVNCAGIKIDSFIMKMSEDMFDKVLEVNLKGTYLMIQYFSKLLVEHNMPGSFINIGSIIGKIGNMGQCNYSASKSGVEAITKTAAKELGRYGIRCNVVHPGLIKTPMVESVPPKVKNILQNQIALGRLGEPEEVAQVLVFLASDKSSYVNGASIEVTGGGF